MPGAKPLHAGILLFLAIASLAHAQVFGKLVASGTPPTASIAVPEQGEACLELPAPLGRLETPPRLTARVGELQVCLKAEEGFAGGSAKLTIGGTEVQLRLETQGEPGSFVLALDLPKAPNPKEQEEVAPSSPSKPANPPEPLTLSSSKQEPGLPLTLSPSKQEPGLPLTATLQYLPDRRALALFFVLSNPAPVPAVLREQDVQIFVGERQITPRIELTFSSGRREWLSPRGSASGRALIEAEDLAKVFPSGEIKLQIKLNLLDDKLSISSAQATWILLWYPVASKGSRP